ncbi:MAG TPA: alcohol dehydrogenase [Aquifex sp.]|nr:alcohol dehydrogenase [Aquifex sp.]
MKAVLLTSFGDRNVFQYTESFPKPEINPNEVLVRVKACALNHLDIWIRKGVLAFKPNLPHILGSDIAGVVEEVGELVKNVKPGDEVVVNPNFSCNICEACLSGWDNHCKEFKILGFQITGGYAEFVKVPQENVIPKPKNLSFEEAASFPLTYITAWNALIDKGKVSPGKTVFVWGGASGVGVATIQLVKLFGATVVTTTSSDWKVQKLKELGADYVINHQTEDIEKRVREIFPEGVDLVIDHVGEKTLPISLKLLKKGGRLSFLGTTTGSKGNFDIRYCFVNEITMNGIYMGRKSTLFEIAKLFEKRLLKPVVDKIFPLREAEKAHRYLEEGKHFGKVILTVED